MIYVYTLYTLYELVQRLMGFGVQLRNHHSGFNKPADVRIYGPALVGAQGNAHLLVR